MNKEIVIISGHTGGGKTTLRQAIEDMITARAATEEEKVSVEAYIKEHSTETGITFDSFIDKKEP